MTTQFGKQEDYIPTTANLDMKLKVALSLTVILFGTKARKEPKVRRAEEWEECCGARHMLVQAHHQEEQARIHQSQASLTVKFNSF